MPSKTRPLQARSSVRTKSVEDKPQPFRLGRARTGLGLFATEEIKKGQFIVEYLGEKLTNEQADKRAHSRYLFELNSRWTIDGAARWNIARYINHSCRPNSEPYITRGRIKIRARKRILPGEEINYDYGKAHFDEFIKPKGCQCDACREKRAKAATTEKAAKASPTKPAKKDSSAKAAKKDPSAKKGSPAKKDSPAKRGKSAKSAKKV